MPFTNAYDVTFPPDTQLANLLGQDLRNFRVDTQQRMAAISGLDAAKPNFAGDTQPANWNGILFFATDTGKIYQFNNPAWTDVTGSLKAPASVIFKSTVQLSHTGTTTADTLYTIALPIQQVNSFIDVFTAIENTTQGSGSSFIQFFLAGSLIGQQGITNTTPTTFTVRFRIKNMNLTNSQTTSFEYLQVNGLNAAGGVISTSAVDTSVSQNLIIKAVSANNSDQQKIDQVLVTNL